MADVSNILQRDDELNDDQLKKYLSGEASQEEMHAIEKNMADDAFVNDAVEGLQAFSSQNKLDDYVSQLNKKLHQHLESGKERKEKRKIDLSWVILAVIIILLLCIIAFWVIRLQHENSVKNDVQVQLYHMRNNDGKFIL